MTESRSSGFAYWPKRLGCLCKRLTFGGWLTAACGTSRKGGKVMCKEDVMEEDGGLLDL